jgi:ABC-type arginine/histidine transport system permease subunit
MTVGKRRFLSSFLFSFPGEIVQLWESLPGLLVSLILVMCTAMIGIWCGVFFAFCGVLGFILRLLTFPLFAVILPTRPLLSVFLLASIFYLYHLKQISTIHDSIFNNPYWIFARCYFVDLFPGNLLFPVSSLNATMNTESDFD